MNTDLGTDLISSKLNSCKYLPVSDFHSATPHAAYRCFAGYIASKVPGFDSSLLEAGAPIPIDNCGPILMLGHVDADFDFSVFDQRLVVPCLMSDEDWMKAKQEMSMADGFIRGMLEDCEFRPYISYEYYCQSKELDLGALNGYEQDRILLEWYLSVGVYDDTDRSNILTSLDFGEREFHSTLNQSWKMALDRGNGHLVGKTSTFGGKLESDDGDIYEMDSLACIRLGILPFYATEKVLFIYTSDISNRSLRFDVEPMVFGRKICYVSAGEQTIEVGNTSRVSDIGIVDYESDDPLQSVNSVFNADGRDFEGFEAADNLDDGEMIVKWMLVDCANAGVSDIFVGTDRGGNLLVRRAINGQKQPLLTAPASKTNGIVSHIKRFSGIDAGSKKHAEGRFTFTAGHKVVDVRVALMISGDSYNEQHCFTLRLLDQTNAGMRLHSLGLHREDLRILSRAYKQHHGLILTSGGTGQGKSTTLSAIITEISGVDKVVYTLEDPIESKIPFADQFLATSNPDKIKAGAMSFGKGLSRLLRMAPDIIMLGEIRDEETARIAPEAANTGHLVFSTVHANDAPNVISRMTALGADPHGFSQALILASSQVLIKTLCSCSLFKPASARDVRYFERAGISATEGKTLVRIAHGCPSCHHTGYNGRRVVMEFIEMNNELRDLIAEGESIDGIRQAARKHGYRSIFEKGMQLVLDGVTTISVIEPYGGRSRDDLVHVTSEYKELPNLPQKDYKDSKGAKLNVFEPV